jgi:Cu+-exporting ATPase
MSLAKRNSAGSVRSLRNIVRKTVKASVITGRFFLEEAEMIQRRCMAVVLGEILLTGWSLLACGDASCAEGEATHQHGSHAGMEHAVKAPEVVVDLETRPAGLKTGSPASILFFIKDTEGKPIRDLTITHERLVHVMVISADFSVFAHIHPDDFGAITPEMIRNAEFTVRYSFPKGGTYLIALDSAVKDVPFSEHFTVEVGGLPAMGLFKKDFSREKRFGEYQVSLISEPARVTAGKETVLRYTIKKDGKPVADLEPYLSAPMHVAVVQDDLGTFVHEHGVLPGMDGGMHGMTGHMHMMHVPDKFGPEIDVHITFPAKGIYQIFSEVKHQGRVITLSFMTEVE